MLNEKERDDYMRNPCERAQHKWLIIELCETVLVCFIYLFFALVFQIAVIFELSLSAMGWFFIGWK